jgi:hypothetical protein
VGVTQGTVSGHVAGRTEYSNRCRRRDVALLECVPSPKGDKWSQQPGQVHAVSVGQRNSVTPAC